MFDAGGNGTNYHEIVDAWVYENEQLVGVYEMPAVVPILKNGPVDIRIQPGVKLDGQAASRYRTNFIESYEANVELFADSAVCINPTLGFKEWVTFPWLEDFDDSNGMSLTSSSFSEGELTTTSGAEAFKGSSAVLKLPAGSLIYECQHTEGFPLPSGGVPAILEFSYKCNHTFLVGLISETSSQTNQTGILALTPTEDWNHVYVNLTEVASANFTATAHIPFFGFVRADGFDADIEIYLDNIRVMY